MRRSWPIWLVSGLREQVLRCSAASTRRQFFFDGDAHTSRLMMDRHLLAHGFDAITRSVAAHEACDEALRVLFVDDHDDERVRLFIDCPRQD